MSRATMEAVRPSIAEENGESDFQRLMKQTLTPKEVQAIDIIERTVRECQTVLAEAESKVAKAVMMAIGVQRLRQLITHELMQDYFMPLMNTRLGFKTDRDPMRKDKSTGQNYQPYGEPAVKECLIEALMHGAWPVGNEFNIISYSAYLTKEFFTRVVGEVDGVTDVVASPGVPQNSNGRTMIRFGLTWKKNGIADSLKDADGKPGRVFEIKSDQYSSADQVIGKATRKAYAAAYQQITGSKLSVPDGDVEETAPIAAADAKPSLADRLNKQPEPAGAHPTPKTDDSQTIPNEDGIDEIDKFMILAWEAAEQINPDRKLFETAVANWLKRCKKPLEQTTPQERANTLDAIKTKAGFFSYLAQPLLVGAGKEARQ